ncbi:hypothetical protein H2201_002234 [Coniosporium apollinis]|uniref:Uncharacterized protein n=2 Tax=Coniosporium TaxID=2810619 RepID=A0ABQ9P2C5_9PEZI|nr:hypothetical protein H2199_005665 [Cladosporium sp. JES 115]KAJ9667699.1 hypothetical protein H2201_002234 [Coniosporium apollinis]
MATKKDPYATTPKIDFSKPVDGSILKGESVLVTGGANGIGAGIATAIAEAGAYVTVADINPTAGEELVSGLVEKGLHVQFCHTDVTSWSSQLETFKRVLSFSPSQTIDVVIAVAGLSGTSIRHWLNGPTDANNEPTPPPTRVLDVNLTGVFYTMHLALHYFRDTGVAESSVRSKQIVFMSSLAGYLALPMSCDYQAAKFGVRGLFKSLRTRTGVLGEGKPMLRCNLIAPTFIKTQMTAMLEEPLKKIEIPMAEVADVVDGCMRLVANEETVGRAIAIAPSRDGKPGSGNFDLCDDYEGLDAGRETLNKLRDGTLGGDAVADLGVFTDAQAYTAARK